MTEGTSPGFGATLRDARLAAGKELEDLADATRVPKRYLEAMETEDWSALPEGVIGRGFVRLVARELELPEKEVLGKYREARGEEGPAKRLVPPESEWKVDFRRERGPGPVLLTLLFLLGAGLGIWVWSPWSVDIAPPPPAESPAAGDALPSRDAAEASAPEESVASQSEAATESGSVPEAAGDLAPAVTAAPAPAAAPLPAPVAGHRLEILAVERVWVRTTVDGGSQRDRLLEPGKREVLEVGGTATLRLGNAGGVRLSWDGEALKVPGAVGQVRTLTFPGALERLRP